MVYLIGASGHAKVIIETLEELRIPVIALQDANPAVKSLLGYEVFQELPDTYNPVTDRIIISIGNNTIRKKLALSIDCKYFTAIHPNATISKSSKIGEGSVVMAGATVNSSVKIGRHAIINTNASIDHDCILGDYVHVSPNAAVAGIVEIGEGTHIGI